MNKTIQKMSPEEAQTRRKLGQQSVNAWGTAYILTARFKIWSIIKRLITLTGILIPVVIGLTYLSFTDVIEETKWILWAGSSLALVHGITSAIVAVWANEDKSYTLNESAAKNRNIAIRSDRLAKSLEFDYPVFSALAQELINEYQALEEHDENRLGASQRDRRIGLRAGLFRFKRMCAACKAVPKKEKRFFAYKPCNSCGEPRNGIKKS